MSKDPHLKRQKQIRMSEDVRQRFEKAQKNSGLTGEEFIARLLDQHDRRNEPSTDDLLAMLRARIPDKKPQ